MDYNKFILHQNTEKNESELCVLNGTCSPSPIISYMHEIILSYLQELAFYLLKLRDLGITNDQIKTDVMNAISGLIINLEYSEEQFFQIINKIFTNLTQAKELYISVCDRNNLHASLLKSQLKTPQNLNYSEAIAKGQKLFRKKYDKLNSNQLNMQEIILNVLKSLAIHLVEIQGLGDDDSATYHSILELLSSNRFKEYHEEENKEFIKRFVELDHSLMMKLYQMKESRYGKMTPVTISLTTRANKIILVSGTNLKELELILEATKDKNIDIYTHGHMITAHAYPFFKKYTHLVGHYGKDANSYITDFASFPGAIFMTRHSLENIKNLYRSRIFTSDIIAPKGVIIIKDNNFEPLIQSALNAKGFKNSRTAEPIKLNLNENKIIQKVAEVCTQIEKGKIKNFLTIGVSNHTKKQSDYFNKLLPMLKEDCFAFSFSYTNSKENVYLIEADYGFPILFNALEYLNKRIGVKNVNLTIFSTRCEVHTLSSVIYLKLMGIKNIVFNDCPSNFINPVLIKAFRELYNLEEYSTPEADYKKLFTET